LRVGFTLIGGAGWTGGANYLENLLSVLSEMPQRRVNAVLFVGTDIDANDISRLSPYLSEPPVISSVWNRNKIIRTVRNLCAFILQRDYLAERQYRRASIDIVFQHGVWYGSRFGIPTVAWIADFQHRLIPEMFSKRNYYWRDVGYKALSRYATRIMVSSQDAKKHCELYYKDSIDRVDPVPFAVNLREERMSIDLSHIQDLYDLPEKYFYLPNQFWKHKNHITLIKALILDKKLGGEVVIVATGNSADARHPEHFQLVLELIKSFGLESRFIYLGMIPYEHVLALIRLSAGLVNPSLFEGWSTTVEEAKAVGAPLLLSNISVHREQAERNALFFDPGDVRDIQDKLEKGWKMYHAGPRGDSERVAKENNRNERIKFSRRFCDLVEKTLQQP